MHCKSTGLELYALLHAPKNRSCIWLDLYPKEESNYHMDCLNETHTTAPYEARLSASGQLNDEPHNPLLYWCLFVCMLSVST